MSLNKASLIGNCGKDPEVRRIANGTAVASFSLATSEKFTDKSGEKREETEWHKIVVWGKLAELVEKYVKKGSMLYAEGKIKTRTYDDKDGKKCYTTEIVCDEIKFLGGNKQSGGATDDNQGFAPPITGATAAQQSDDFDGLPF